MTTAQALVALGVSEDNLSLKEREMLDELGFLPLPGILSQEQIQGIRGTLSRLTAAEGAEAGKEVHQEAGTDRLSDLVNKGECFRVCFTHPRVLAAISHVLKGDLKLSSLNSRAALPGEGLQALHADWHGPVSPGDYYVCNSIWLLDDFTTNNGATRVVPGSHRSGRVPNEEMADTKAAHPNEVQLVAEAGTVVIFNSHTWHGGTVNRSDKPRRALHSYFCRRDQPQQLDQRRYIRPEIRDRLSEAERFVLDIG